MGEWEKLWSSCTLWNTLRDEDVESDIFTLLPFPSLLMIQSRNDLGHFMWEKMLGWSETKGEKQVTVSSALWFNWMKAQSCQLMIWSSVLQCIVLSYSSRSAVMEGLKIYSTAPPPAFPCRFHDFKENIANMTSVYPQDWGSRRQWIKNWLRLWSEKMVIHSSYKKIKKKCGLRIARSNFEQYREVPGFGIWKGASSHLFVAPWIELSGWELSVQKCCGDLHCRCEGRRAAFVNFYQHCGLGHICVNPE